MDEAHEPLLGTDTKADDEVAALHEMDVKMTSILESWQAQGKMAWPIVLQLVSMYMLAIISLSFVGHIGKQELAAAALGSSFVNMLGRMVLMGLNGALDTLASQAAGSGDHASLPTLYYRSVLFMWVHAIPLTIGLLAVPQLLTKGTDTELADKAFKYLALLIPNLWLDCVSRPVSSVLVAQRITQPQMWVALIMVPLHFGTNYLFIHVLEMGYLGAALATCASSVYSLILMYLYLAVSGKLSTVFGPITAQIFKGWGLHASLAYPACFMRVAESLGFSLMTVASGLLPDPDTAVAAASCAFSLYGILYMGFAAFGVSTMTFVGNALGTGDALQAKVSAIASILMAPILWLVVGGMLLEPHTQRWLALLFTDGSDPALMYHLHLLLNIVAMLELFDGTQTIMSGIITGCGKQKHGAFINLVAFYVLAIPTALVLGFWMKQGVEGMYLGMLLGPLTQMIWYGAVVMQTNWTKEAKETEARLRGARGE